MVLLLENELNFGETKVTFATNLSFDKNMTWCFMERKVL